jgi:hypothetical protein
MGYRPTGMCVSQAPEGRSFLVGRLLTQSSHAPAPVKANPCGVGLRPSLDRSRPAARLALTRRLSLPPPVRNTT